MGLLYVESRKKMWISLWIIWKNPWMEMNPMLWIMVENVENSFMAFLGGLLAPIFAPLGFADWRASTALITGLTAKETVISTLKVLLSAGDQSLSSALTTVFTPLSSLSFLVFTLLYMPCVAAMAAARRELGSRKNSVLAMIYQTGVAWIAGMLVFQVGSLLGG